MRNLMEDDAVKIDFAYSHWLTFCFLIPFLIMLAIHRVLGLSDNMMVAPAPGVASVQLYNFAMVAVLYGGGFAFIMHTASIAYRGRNWMLFKFLFLVVFLKSLQLVW